RHFAEARKQDAAAFVRPILVGPPREALDSLFDLLTGGGSSDWLVQFQQGRQSIPVLLVTGEDSVVAVHGNGSMLSRRCHCDYAVTVRNSCPLVLMLASPASWDNRPESLANTTETLGSPSSGRGGFRDSSWKHLLRSVSTARAIDEN